MKKTIIYFMVLLLIIIKTSYSEQVPSDLFPKFINIKGPYLGQSPPGMIPETFDPFLLDYKKHHIHSAPAFSEKGDELFFSLYENYKFPQKIFYTKMSKNGLWSKPVVAEFSGIYQDGGPLWSPDYKRVYFYSRRPDKDGDKARKESRIWFIERQQDSWENPELLEMPKGSGIAFYPSHFGFDSSFYIEVKLGARDYKIFKGIIAGKKIKKLIHINKPVTIDPENEYLIHNVIDRKKMSDQFEIGFKNPDGSWSETRSIGDTINKNGSRFPVFSPDGKYFFFCSYRSGYEQIYWVSRKLFEICKNNDLNVVKRLSDILKKKDISDVKIQFGKMKRKLSTYYPFSQQILNDAAYSFLSNGDKILAIKALKLNFSLYPEIDFLIEHLLISALTHDGFNTYSSILEKEKTKDSRSLLDRINVLAYYIMNGGFIDEAIKVYQLNTRLFPESSKVFDRLGRVYLKKKLKLKAIKSYRRALILDPQNQDALKAMEQFKKDGEVKQ